MDDDPLGPHALDFWLGTWSLSWADGGEGTNTIRRILDDRVIEESFEGRDGSGPLLGRSLSVVDSSDGRWRQTWVDSTGGYLAFVGVDVDGGIAFQRTTAEDRVQRMRWLDRTADGFEWQWERSTDGGATWELLWAIRYRRLDEEPAAPKT